MQNHQLASVVSVIAQSVPKPRMALIGEHCSQLWMGEADLCTDSIAIAHMCFVTYLYGSTARCVRVPFVKASGVLP